METYVFPDADELTRRLDLVWPSHGYLQLQQQVLGFAGQTVSIDGLVGCLSLAIEDFVAKTKRSAEFRLAAYASLPPVIRVLVDDKPTLILALNEYLSMLARLRILGLD